jgi:uncharacterized membrane protein YbhN (UPF0104 family)
MPVVLPPARPPRVRPLLTVAALLAVLAVAVAGLTGIDLGAAASALAQADPELLAAAVALYALSQTISGAMWWVCQGAGGIHVPASTTLGLHWISRGSCELLPANLGEGVRVAVVRRHPGGAAAGTWRIAGGLAGHKVIDGAVTALVVLVIALATPLPGPAAGLRWTALATVLGMVALAVAWRLGRARGVARLLPGRTRRVAARLGEGAGVLSDPGAARLSAVLGLLAVAVRIAGLAALLAALGISPLAAPLAFAAIVLAGIVPGAPGGAGAREVVLLPALALAHGVGGSQALAFSLAVQATALATSLALAFAALAWLGPSLLAGRRAAVEPALGVGLERGAVPAAVPPA